MAYSALLSLMAALCPVYMPELPWCAAAARRSPCPCCEGCSASTWGGRARSSPAPASPATASRTWSRALGTTALDLFSWAENIEVSGKDLTTTS